MYAIEFDAVAHNGLLTIPETYRADWNEKNVRVILIEVNGLTEEQAREQLEVFLKQRVEAAEQGLVVNKSVIQIFEETYKEGT